MGVPSAVVATGAGEESGARPDPEDIVDVATGGALGDVDAPATTAAPLRTFTVATTGDFLLHMPVQRKALAYGGGVHDFSPMLAEIAPVISAADLALCHMETPISSDNTNLTGYPLFNAPKEIADAAAAASVPRQSRARANRCLPRAQPSDEDAGDDRAAPPQPLDRLD